MRDQMCVRKISRQLVPRETKKSTTKRQDDGAIVASSSTRGGEGRSLAMVPTFTIDIRPPGADLSPRWSSPKMQTTVQGSRGLSG